MPKSSRDLPPLEWIRVFETAARHLNFSAAAAELGLTQAAVSQRIRNLELRIGAQLFNRHPRGVTLTVQGEAWLPHVQLALSQLGRSTANLFAAPRRKVTLAASSSVIGLWIVPRLTRIATRLPQLQIACETIHTLTGYDRIEADFEIRFDTFVQSLQAALAGAGVILGSLPLCEAEIAAGRLVRLSPDSLKMQTGYWATWDSDATPFRERDILLDLLISPEAGQRPRSAGGSGG